MSIALNENMATPSELVRWNVRELIEAGLPATLGAGLRARPIPLETAPGIVTTALLGDASPPEPDLPSKLAALRLVPL